MSLKSTAQELIMVDPSSMSAMDGMSLIPLEVSDFSPDSHEHGESMEVSEPAEIEIVIEDLPGAPAGTHDPEPEPVLEVSEEDDKGAVDENEAKKSKKNEKWDWESQGPHGFVAWIKARIDDVPKHSGYDSAGLERAMSYLERLDNEISRAMRLDLDGELDANKIEAVRSQIDEGLSRLHDRLDKVKKHSKTRRKKKAEVSDVLIKEAQKITGVQGIYIVAPLFASRIARVCINGMVSAGHDIEDLYARQVKRWKLSEREQAEVMQLLADMGYPLRQDRGFMPDEDVDFASSDNMDWAANYKG
jgi:ElaB/YqjD/DUF883 family membrane-anchored ribosome-binding protein